MLLPHTHITMSLRDENRSSPFSPAGFQEQTRQYQQDNSHLAFEPLALKSATHAEGIQESDIT